MTSVVPITWPGGLRIRKSHEGPRVRFSEVLTESVVGGGGIPVPLRGSGGEGREAAGDGEGAPVLDV